jgi:DNA polymerase-3 subunit epsilon
MTIGSGPAYAANECEETSMSYSTGELIAMAEALEQSADYRILRRLVPRGVSKPPAEGAKIAILVDFETTGLDTCQDEVIEIGMVKFCYSERGDVIAVADTFSSFNQPSKPIPAEVTALTGITNEIVAGHGIDAEAVASFVTDADVIIAHNAKFDRRFAERGWPVFAEKCWACSVRETDCRKHGIDGAKLGYLLAAVGYFHDGHRAVEDCQALLEILARETALAALLERSNCPTYRIWAERAPYDFKDVLKKRGYRWNDGNDARPKAWYIDVYENHRDQELRFLKENIYQRDVELYSPTITAIDRFSVRS